MSAPEFALFWVLRGQGLPQAQELAVDAGSVLEAHAGWPYNDDLERNARLGLYKILKDLPAEKRMSDERASYGVGRGRAAAMKETVDSLLRMHRMVAQ